jgi:hypothetical protein
VSTEGVETVTVTADISAVHDAFVRLAESAGPVVHALSVLSTGWVQDALRLQQEIEQFRLAAERAGVSAEQAERLLDDAMEASRSSPRPFCIEDAYDRLWRSTGVQAFYGDGGRRWWTQRVRDFLEGQGVGDRSLGDPRPLRLPGESRIDATERVLSSYSYGADTHAFDTRPENCWRCDAKQAETDVGLCTPCHGDLRGS